MNRLQSIPTMLSLAITVSAQGQNPSREPDKSNDFQFMGQATFTLQNELGFRSPYFGPNSFLSRRETQLSHTYTLFIGKRVRPNLEFYVNPEMARGGGLSETVGLAGYVNGDVIRNPTLNQEPYIGRVFVRWSIATGPGKEHVDEAENQIAGERSTRRLVVTAGKLGANDLFDTNGYANNTRSQFMNWALINNAAYDYAADTRGYTLGIAVEWVQPSYTVRLGSFQMPKVANGIDLDGDLAHAHGDQIEVETHPILLKDSGRSTLRVLGYRNTANMGDYREALALASQDQQTPDVTLTRRPGRVKYGFGLSFEQPFRDNGETGLFARACWNDGATESFAYTEAEQSYSLGVQLSGKRWHAPKDRFAIALAQNELGAAHRDYLAAGGLGFILGDGKLSYAPERILEAYYSRQMTKQLSLALDFQAITNPGYNRDRGPVPVLGLRLHFEF